MMGTASHRAIRWMLRHARSAYSSLLRVTKTQSTMNSSMGTESVNWQAEPITRGTWGIFSSCLITLFLCVYTAVHLNIPWYNESLASRCYTWAKWISVGVFAPEIMVYSAWVQWRTANQLNQAIAKILIDVCTFINGT